MTHSNQEIIFCGGGSGGHVVPARTVIKELLKKYPELKVEYIGSVNGIEADLIGSEGIPFYGISSGKLRRYFSWQNFTDIFKILFGIIQSLLIIKNTNQNAIIFSFGGFVSVPPVIAAWIFGRKILIHEQTTQVGLANKINSHFADKVFISFEASKQFFLENKVSFTGYPVRESCHDQEIDMDAISRYLSKTENHKKLMLVTGGGNGSRLINQLIYDNLDYLKNNFHIIHQVGKDFLEVYKPYEDENYLIFDFIGSEMIDLFKKADIVISRAGAGTVSELLTLGKRSIFIPLKIAQKNEQYHNAMEAKEKIGSIVLVEGDLTNETFRAAINELQTEFKDCILRSVDGTKNIIRELEEIMQI